jgi:RNA polymerase subunit RPABC4/transcription elongation factor Spt4
MTASGSYRLCPALALRMGSPLQSAKIAKVAANGGNPPSVLKIRRRYRKTFVGKAFRWARLALSERMPQEWIDAMILTDVEISEVAERLHRTSTEHLAGDQSVIFSQLPSLKQMGYRKIVVDLAAQIDLPHSPEAVRVFMVWMGDDVDRRM